MLKKKLLFITGTRADFGKLKPLIKIVNDSPKYEVTIFVTGMHMLAKYGNTISEIKKSGFSNLYMYINQMEGENMEIILANTILGLTRYLHENNTDLIIIHGDRIEALAGAIVGALRNILVAHIEGGEVSGTIDDVIRHATTKLSHLHFVANVNAERRLRQLGEDKNSIHKIGSPDIDIMLSDKLPNLSEVKKHYDIYFDDYALAILHPVTTEIDAQHKNALIFAEALLLSNKNYLVIYPNNDMGSNEILRAYDHFKNNSRIKLYPSIRFEYFLSLLKNAQFIIGNSSAGIHEAPVYGVPTINIGTRQNNRFDNDSIINVPFYMDSIITAINSIPTGKRFKKTNHFGNGSSAESFINVLNSGIIWNICKQKTFRDVIID